MSLGCLDLDWARWTAGGGGGGIPEDEATRVGGGGGGGIPEDESREGGGGRRSVACPKFVDVNSEDRLSTFIGEAGGVGWMMLSSDGPFIVGS